MASSKSRLNIVLCLHNSEMIFWSKLPIIFYRIKLRWHFQSQLCHIQEAFSKADKDLKSVDIELNKKVEEATKLHEKRDKIAQEGRRKQKGIRDITGKVKAVSRNISDLEGQKRDLEKARDECIEA